MQIQSVPQSILFLLPFVLVTTIGYASHSASLCNVRAVDHLIERRDPRMLLTFLKAAGWATAVAGLVALGLAMTNHSVMVGAPVWVAMLGGFLFGVGAAVNGGCSMSTLQRLADGYLPMLATLLCFCIGSVLLVAFVGACGIRRSTTIETVWSMQMMNFTVLAALWIWAAFEIVRIVRRRFVAQPHALPALLIGASGGLAFALYGSWSYTNMLRSVSQGWWSGQIMSRPVQILLILALFAGMLVSAMRRRSGKWQFGNRAQWRGAILGGTCMGIGGALLPGGNDTVLLVMLPAQSTTGVLSYLSLLIGIALVLFARRSRLRDRNIHQAVAERAMDD
ncbi:MAG: YeeE/YedE thiosulfate transporter family protein [Dokdonella sp.]